MTQTISRMYSTRAQAEKAAAEAREHGFDHVYIFGGNDHGNSHDALVSAMTNAYVEKYHAAAHTKQIIKDGGTLVTVHAPFTGGLKARTILEAHGPIESGVAEPVYKSYAYDEKTPLSSSLQMPVLMKTKQPFSAFWNLPVLVRSGAVLSKALGLPVLTKQPKYYSAKSAPLLSKSKTPFSSRLGLPLLTR
jgi:hypothetical protein